MTVILILLLAGSTQFASKTICRKLAFMVYVDLSVPLLTISVGAKNAPCVSADGMILKSFMNAICVKLQKIRTLQPIRCVDSIFRVPPKPRRRKNQEPKVLQNRHENRHDKILSLKINMFERLMSGSNPDTPTK